MRKLFLTISTIAFLSNPALAKVQKFELEKNHASVLWIANHLGFSNVSGKFNEVEGEIIYDEKNPEKSSVTATIHISKLSTGLPDFDAHLKSGDFFDIEKFTTAKFVSKKIVVTGKNRAKIHGNLTLLGVTKPVILDSRLNKIGLNSFSQRQTIGLSAKTQIKRSQFGMDYAVPAVSDNINIVIEVEGILK